MGIDSVSIPTSIVDDSLEYDYGEKKRKTKEKEKYKEKKMIVSMLMKIKNILMRA